MSALLEVGYFLATLFFSLVIFALWLRFALRFFKVSSLHPISQSIHRLTDTPLKFIERFATEKTRSKLYDWPCFALIVVVEFLKFLVLGFLLYNTVLPVSYLVLFVVADLIAQPCNLFFYMILIRVVMSWVNPNWHTPAADIIKRLTDPLLVFGRQLIPDISGFDFSPFIVMIILKVITMFMSASLPLRLV